jgi:hypothetical protein
MKYLAAVVTVGLGMAVLASTISFAESSTAARKGGSSAGDRSRTGVAEQA